MHINDQACGQNSRVFAVYQVEEVSYGLFVDRNSDERRAVKFKGLHIFVVQDGASTLNAR
jgi:hypothetical protein